MEFHGCDLRHGNEALDGVDLQVGFAVALHDCLLDQFGHAGSRMSLKPFFVIDAVRSADDRAGATLEVLDHPGSDAFEVAGEIELGDRCTFALSRPQLLVGLRDRHTHHLIGVALRLSGGTGAFAVGWGCSEGGRTARLPGDLVGTPDRPWIGRLGASGHEGFGPSAFAGGDLIHGAAGGDRAILRE